MSFYMTLPSNGSQTYFKENRITNYKIKLPSKVQLNPREYEVGLVDITYVCSLKTLTGNKDNAIYIDYIDRSYRAEKTHYIPLTHYSTIDQLILAINSLLNAEDAAFLYQKSINRVSINLRQGVFLSFSEKLSDILGFDGRVSFGLDIKNESFPACAKFAPDILGGRYHMFIYTDIIQPQIVGSSLVPMLRMVNITGKEGEAVSKTFMNPYYLELSRSELDIISVLICNELGEELPIDKGQVTLTLHFRHSKFSVK